MDEKQRMMKELVQLCGSIKRITKDLRKIEDSWDEHFAANDPQDMYLRGQFCRMEDKLSDVNIILKEITSEVVAQGRIYHNSSKRYEIEGTDFYFTSGSYIEVLYEGEWFPSSVEHNGEDYYLTRLKGVNMRGLMARAKRFDWD